MVRCKVKVLPSLRQPLEHWSLKVQVNLHSELPVLIPKGLLRFDALQSESFEKAGLKPEDGEDADENSSAKYPAGQRAGHDA